MNSKYLFYRRRLHFPVSLQTAAPPPLSHWVNAKEIATVIPIALDSLCASIATKRLSQAVSEKLETPLRAPTFACCQPVSSSVTRVTVS